MKLKQVDTNLGEFTISIHDKVRTGTVVVSKFYTHEYAPAYKEFLFFDIMTGEFFAKYGVQAAWIRLP